jgi:hypothetical protein
MRTRLPRTGTGEALRHLWLAVRNSPPHALAEK